VDTEKRYPISEVFGPTMQGEGPLIGTKTYFVRFAGCDYDCSWCDTKYAVLPKYPGWSRTMMTLQEIVVKLGALGIKSDEWITLSGGNPALFVDMEFMRLGETYKLAMETQGSKTMPDGVAGALDCLIISPKPPSSGMDMRYDSDPVQALLSERDLEEIDKITALKFVVFDEVDLEWVIETSDDLDEPSVKHYLSIGTPLNAGVGVRDIILDDLARWVEVLTHDPRLANWTILPQLHTLLWGQKRGV